MPPRVSRHAARTVDTMPVGKFTPSMLERYWAADRRKVASEAIERLHPVVAAQLGPVSKVASDWITILNNGDFSRAETRAGGYLANATVLLCYILSDQHAPKNLSEYRKPSWEVLAYARGDKTVNWGADPDYNS